MKKILIFLIALLGGLVMLLVFRLGSLFFWMLSYPTPVEGRSFAPDKCPNSLWICQEEKICLVVDNNFQIHGCSEVDNTLRYFDINIEEQGLGGNVNSRKSMDVSRGGGGFYGLIFNAEFYEDRFELSYQGEADKEETWGEKSGEVRLTFVKLNLPGPVVYTENGYRAGDQVVVFGTENDPLRN